MTLPMKRWLILCAAGLACFPAVWVFCQVILELTPDVSSAIAGAVIAIVLVPLGTWAANASPEVDQPDLTAEPFVELAAATEPRGSDAEYIDSYRTLVRQRYRHVDMEVLTPLSEQDDYPLVPLEEVFVVQDVKADPSSAELPRELILRLLEGYVPSPQELPPGTDQAELLQVRASYEQEPAVEVLSLLADESANRLILLGDPGAGKSTLARYVAFMLAHNKVDGPLRSLAGWLPVLIELREFAQRSSETFLEFLEHLHRSNDLGLPGATLERLLREDGKALIIFDGLDEIFDPDARQRTIVKIVWFATNYPHTRIVVTSRPIDFRRSALESAGFRRHKLQDLDQKKIEAFVQSWYHIACPTDTSQAGKLRGQLLTAIDTSGSVRELAGNPLLLTILAIIGRRHHLPRDRRTVYEHAVTVLIDQWDPSRFLQDQKADGEIPYLDAADKLEMLRLIARRMQDSPAGLSGNFISGADLISEFTSFLQQRDATGLTTEQAKQAANIMLRQFRQRNFVLSRFGSELYGFVHRSFLEYLAAADVVHRFASERTMSEADLVSGVFGTRWREPAWHEVLVLTSGMLDHKFASKAIMQLLEEDPHWAASHAAEPHQIFVAIRCLAESRQISRQAEPCRTAIGKLIHLLTVAHRRTTRSYDDSLNRAIEQTLLPIFESFGPFWPGREQFLTWYTGGGSADVDDPSTMAVAIKLAIALLGDDDDLLAFLRVSASGSHRPAQRQAAVWAIANTWPNDRAGMDLVHRAALTDPHEGVRQTAMRAVAASRPGDPATLAMLRRIATGDTHEDLRHASVQAVAADWGADAATAGFLRDIALRDQHVDVRQAAILAIASTQLPDPQTLELLRDLFIGDEHDDIRVAALSALQAVQPQPSDFLKARLSVDRSDDVRRLIVTMVVDKATDDPQTLSWLSELATHDRSAGVRQTALSLIADGWAGSSIARTLLLGRAAQDDSADVREAAIKVVGAESFSTAETFDRLRRLAEDDTSENVRQAATRIIAIYRRQEQATLGWLRQRASSDPDQRVRAAAIREITEGWQDVADIAMWLRQRAINDDTAAVRCQAVKMIANAWSSEPETRQWLEERATDDPSEEVRQGALQAMADGWPHHPQTLARLNDRAIADVHEYVRHTAVESIVAHWRHDNGVWPLLVRLTTKDPHDLIRRLAVRIIADGWPHSETMKVVMNSVDDPHPAVRGAALQALSYGWPEDTRTLQALKKHLTTDRDEYVRKTAVHELARRWRDDPDIAALLYNRMSEDPHQVVRHVLLQEVVAGQHQERETFAAVSRLADTDSHPAIRCDALQALADYWPADPITSTLLAKHAQMDPDETVRAVASDAIVTLQTNPRASL